MKIKVQMFKGKDGWRVRLRARNGEIVMVSEGYSTKAMCKKTADKLATALGVKVK